MWGVVFGVLLTVTGVVLVSISSGSLNAADTRRTALLQDAFALSPTSAQYNTFQTASSFGYAMDEPVYTSFFLWNLTNAAQVIGGHAQPKVTQIGPYTYEKKSRKVNVAFHTSISGNTSKPKTTSTSKTNDYGYVSYGVQTTYEFVPQRSNGSQDDVVVTLNATYARTLAKYREHGYSERLMVADFAQRHIQEYYRYLRGAFVAQTKQRALQFFLPQAIDSVLRESVGPAITRQRERIDSASIPGNLVHMYAVARTEAIPQVLSDVMKDISDRFLPEILQKQLDIAQDHALPRVLSNLQQRLHVEAVPVLLQRQIQTQYMRHVPITLQSLAAKLPQVAFPYVMQEVWDRACLDAVPFVLRTIKMGIIQRDIHTNRVQADVAQNNVIETWRTRSGGARVDFDSWIDDNPTGQPRTGFELRPTAPDLEISKEVATLLLGSKPSNKRFSIVDYDTTTTASYPLEVPTDTPVGFAIWKQVIALNESSIAHLIAGVNNDVALVGDYITRAQVLFIRDFLMQWARKDVVLRDRERFWRQNFTRRTTETDVDEPPVDLDIEKVGVQRGFNLQASGASTSDVPPAIARQLWDASDAFAFTNVQGFTIWYQAAVANDAAAKQALLTGVTGMSSDHFTTISNWIQSLLSDKFVTRRALRHWADGTCRTVFKLTRTPCLEYDLEPHVAGLQSGFEMNPQGDSSIVISQALREELWDRTQPSSFLHTVHEADTTKGYGQWLHAARTESTAAIVGALSLLNRTFSSASAAGITMWLAKWSTNALHVLLIQDWWRTATCWPRDVLSTTTPTTTITTSEATCTPSIVETEQSAHIATAAAAQSPFSTTERVLQVAKVECVLDAATSTYTKTASSYQTTVREYSCDVFSTELSDDHAPADAKTGFELAPLLTSASAALRPSLAVVALLWNPIKAFSFLHTTGYKRWVVDFSASPAVTRTALLNEINAQLAVACTSLAGAGVQSAIFNTTFIGSHAGCGAITLDQVDAIQKWVETHHESAWVRSALLDQWRRGDHHDTRLDIEPYRPGEQDGWELSTGCGCALTSDKGTSYRIPRKALALWDVATHDATVLSTKGYARWAALANATRFEDTDAITAKKQAIATACGLVAWEPWLDNVASWLDAWHRNEHLVRDVLSHWLHGTCPTSSAIPVLQVISESAPTVATQSSCPPIQDRYTVTLNDTLEDILQRASRPQFAQFFDSDVVDKTASIEPTKIVEATETWIDCEFVSANQFKHTTWNRVSVKQYPSCNFLRVLANGTTTSVPIVQDEASFEMNRTTETNHVSMDVALAAWLNGTSTSSWAFTNTPVFLSKWQPAIHRSDSLRSLEMDVNTAIPSSTVSVLDDVTHYLERWETSSHSVREIAKAWIVSVRPYLDLDPTTEGEQSGFELFPSPGWRAFAGNLASALPSLDQAQYLWDAKNDYSFLNAKTDLVSGLPVGFNAWRGMYDGVDYSSERLMKSYPENSTIERDQVMVHHLNQTARESLLSLISAATALTRTEIHGIASWLVAWSENTVLRDYLLELWATGLTPRGQADATIDLRRYLRSRLGLDQPEAFTPASSLGDRLTTEAKATLQDLPKATRRSLWDVATTGSLLNPVTRDVWCLIDLPVTGRCPHVLNELGLLNETSYVGFVATVQPVLQDLPSITHTSNLTDLAFKYLERQFSLREDQVLAIARWWRSVPETSVYYQALQMQRWQTGDDPLALVDPLRLGFGLAKVFSDGSPVSRRANVTDLVPNAIDLSPAGCRISQTLVMTLWFSSNPGSFLHRAGLQTWLTYAEHASPRPTSTFTTALGVEDAALARVVAAADTTSVSCTIEAVATWLLSWQHHPLTRQFVESLWYQPSTAAVSPLQHVAHASALALAFPADAGAAAATSSIPSEPALALHARIAEIVFDSNETASFQNLTHGFPIWRALFTSCESSTPTTFKCAPAAATDQEDDIATTTATAALNELARLVATRIQVEYPSMALTTESSVAHVLRDKFIPWLLHWLEHGQLLDFLLTQAAKVDTTLTGKTSAQVRYADFAAIQFVKATFSRVDYALPMSVHSALKDYAEHLGVASEHVTTSQLVFDAATAQVVTRNGSTIAGFGELKAFCDWNQYDRQFAFDRVAVCSFETTYSVSVPEAEAMLASWSDPTEWAIPGSSLHVKKAALLLDAFLAQPFKSASECTFSVDKIAAAYELSAQEIQDACKATVNDGIRLDLPILTAVGFGATASARITDFQAYLRYAATKFVYEPSVLGLPPRRIEKGALATSVEPLGSWTEYPVGGYIAVQRVSDVLSSTNTTMSLWQTQDLGAPVVQATYLLPLRDDVELLYKNKERVAGEIAAINESMTMSVLGTSFPLSMVHATDGSQFTTAILTGRHGLSLSPPPTLLFYWEYSRRLVELKFSTNITRFGIPLMRYTIDSWHKPTSLPDGFMDANDSPLDSVNVTTLFDGVPLALTPHPTALSSSAQEPSREAVVDIDPVTGMVYHRRLTWQLTTQIHGFDDARDYWHAKTAPMWLPVVWVREQHSVSSARASQVVASVVKSGPFATEKLALWGVAGGCAYVLIGAVMSYVYVRRAQTMRLHKMQSVVPVESSPLAVAAPTKSIETLAATNSANDDGTSKSVAHDVNATSDVAASSPTTDGHVSTTVSTPRTRKRTVPQIPTIVEDMEDMGDVHQV